MIGLILDTNVLVRLITRDDLRQAAAQLAKAKLDITTEPAFRFKA